MFYGSFIIGLSALRFEGVKERVSLFCTFFAEAEQVNHASPWVLTIGRN